MKLITCCKVVHDEQDIIAGPDRELLTEKAGWKISLYDLNALEAAVEIARSQPDSHVTVLSLGGNNMMGNAKIRKDILSRGADALIIVADEGGEALYPTDAASILASAARKTGFDLMICGEGSADLYARQMGLQLGELLNVPCIDAVSKITVGQGAIVVERVLENAVEELELTLPAVISVTSDINTPGLPSMKAILAANKKPVTHWRFADLACNVTALTAQRISALVPPQANRLGILIEGDADEQIEAFASHLRRALRQ